MVGKYAQMHQNTFLTTSDSKKYLFWKKVSGGLEVKMQMHQHTFLTTPDGKKYLFWKKFLVVWKYAQMHQNTFLTTPDVKKISFLRTWFWCFWWSGSMCKFIKTRLYHSRRSKISFFEKKFLVVWKYAQNARRSKISFLKKSFWCLWWSGSMRKCIKTRF